MLKTFEMAIRFIKGKRQRRVVIMQIYKSRTIMDLKTATTFETTSIDPRIKSKRRMTFL